MEGDFARVADDVGDAGGGVLDLWRILLACVVVVLLALHRTWSESDLELPTLVLPASAHCPGILLDAPPTGYSI